MINDKHISAPVVFIYIGKKLPSYVIHSVKLAEKNIDNDMYLLTNCIQKKIGNRTILIRIDSKTILNDNHFTSGDMNNFRDGFWNKTIERYGVLYNFMKTYEITRLFHIELDNLIISLEGIDRHLDSLNKGMFFPTDMKNKIGFGNFVYINHLSSLRSFINYINITKNKNDMELLGQFYKDTRNILSFDINESLTNFKDKESLKIIIDGFVFGHYILGYDPKNTMGIIKNKVIFYPNSIDLVNGRYTYKNNKVYLNKKLDTYSFANLHVHSKIFKHISKPNKLKKLVLSANSKQKIIYLDSLILLESIVRYIFKKIDFLTSIRKSDFN